MKTKFQLERPDSTHLRGLLIICCAILICCGNPRAAFSQQQATQPPPKTGTPAAWFKRTFKKAPATTPVERTPSQPTELRVIDRETARRMAMQAHHSDHAYRPEPIDSSVPDWQQPNREVNQNSQSEVQTTSYQQPQRRVYNTPPYNPNHVSTDVFGYPTAANPLRYGQSDQYAPDYVPHDQGMAPDHFQQPQYEQPQYQQFDSQEPQFQPNSQPLPQYLPPPVQPENLRGGSGLIQPEVLPPTHNDQTHSTHAETKSAIGSISVDQVQPAVSESQEFYPPAAVGLASQGYLQGGPVFHGRHLNASQLTATERAMRLLSENNRLKESTAQTHQELSAKTREIAKLQTIIEYKDEDQRQALDRIAALNREVTRLNNELSRQIELRLAMEKRMNDQLQSIESTLDSVLMKSMSDSRPAGNRQ